MKRLHKKAKGYNSTLNHDEKRNGAVFLSIQYTVIIIAIVVILLLAALFSGGSLATPQSFGISLVSSVLLGVFFLPYVQFLWYLLLGSNMIYVIVFLRHQQISGKQKILCSAALLAMVLLLIVNTSYVTLYTSNRSVSSLYTQIGN